MLQNNTSSLNPTAAKVQKNALDIFVIFAADLEKA